MRRDSGYGSDADLIRAARSDAAAFGTLYERHALEVFAWCQRRLEWAASDLTAETFAQAWLRAYSGRRPLLVARQVMSPQARWSIAR